ncbi:hypothetical protein C8P66_108122 [Humitalea rosea]|uniref:2-keto-4-pentenoate hydratase n=1 Tax=Humitalea rosea TaxID=990373 RepID=A0A2W7IJG9_9PROT|nr:hypothetical protein [Humitalea rosea]PZW46843.1 hypothetical protein C8P66_108122 [Humitalea rosea]
MSDRATEAARWLAEAWTSGNPLAALPAGMAPRDAAEGEDVAAALLDALGQPPVGLRIAPDGLVGPLTAGRLVAAGTPVALSGLRHARVTAAVAAVLAEPLGAGLPLGAEPARFSALHPALDVAASRFSGPGADPAAVTADLAGLGLVLIGRGRAVLPGTEAVALAEGRQRPRGQPVDLAARLEAAAAEARARGGLPAGAVLLVAGLSAAVVPVRGARWTAVVGALGRAGAGFV